MARGRESPRLRPRNPHRGRAARRHPLRRRQGRAKPPKKPRRTIQIKQRPRKRRARPPKRAQRGRALLLPPQARKQRPKTRAPRRKNSPKMSRRPPRAEMRPKRKKPRPHRSILTISRARRDRHIKSFPMRSSYWRCLFSCRWCSTSFVTAAMSWRTTPRHTGWACSATTFATVCSVCSVLRCSFFRSYCSIWRSFGRNTSIAV